jgi:hypothetical protein
LLYFNETHYLEKDFRDWIKKTSRKKQPTEDDETLTAFLEEFANQTGTEIQKIATHNTAAATTSGGNSGGAGGRFDGGANEKQKQLIGLVGEMVVYEKLSAVHKNVTWVSRNAAKVFKAHPGYNPDGTDKLGYDIEYIAEDGNKMFVEVKSRSDNHDAFEITKYEIDKARHDKDSYKILMVTYTLDNSRRKIRDLGNVFMVDSSEDFFRNSRFTPVYKTFEIRFQEE